MQPQRIAIVGGGAAGFFAAIACAESDALLRVDLFERSAQFLAKVRISGGGRCNVTHACFDPREFVTRYPRGSRELIGAFQKFQARDTVDWFAARGVALKTESDGRMFPTTDQSQTIVNCLMHAAQTAGVRLHTNSGVKRISRRAAGGFDLEFEKGERQSFDRVLLALGGCRTQAMGELAVALGHTLAPPVPSLFTFHIGLPWLRELAGVSLGLAEVSVPDTKLRERGPLLITHAGLSGPAILRLSAWGARALHAADYQFSLHVNWLPELSAETIATELDSRRTTQPARRLVNAPLPQLPARLWEKLVVAAGIDPELRCAEFSRAAQHKLIQQLHCSPFDVVGKTLNQDEFVTCGGVRLSEVNFKTMESRVCPGLYFAGEILDVDGITGGFNFQAAWTTGWLAGRAMAGAP